MHNVHSLSVCMYTHLCLYTRVRTLYVFYVYINNVNTHTRTCMEGL